MKCFKYTYKSPLNGSVYCEGLVNEDDNRVDFGPYGVADLYNRDPSVLFAFTDLMEDLKDYVPEALKKFVFSAVFGELYEECGRLYLLTRVTSTKQLTDGDQDILSDWIVAQLSDGWGEGVEQKEVLDESICFTFTYFDQDAMEFKEEHEWHKASYYIHPWQHGHGWRLELVDQCEAEMDVPAEHKLEEIKTSLAQVNELVAQILAELNQLT